MWEMPPALARLGEAVVACRACPRLVAWREAAAANRPRRYRDQVYWSRPVPGFGDPGARLVLVGLAPAAHGGNRTGRIFTGDRSGDFLYAALWRAGCSNRPQSLGPGDGLRLEGVYITATVRCAPPGNRPERTEVEACANFLAAELDLLAEKRVLLALGGLAFEACRRYLRWRGADVRGLRFAHEAAYRLALPGEGPGRGEPPASPPASAAESASDPVPRALWLVASYHPSQQNTFTGRLTEAMFDAVLRKALALAGS